MLVLAKGESFRMGTLELRWEKMKDGEIGFSRDSTDRNAVWELVRRGDTVIEVPQKKILNDHEFRLIFTGDSKNKAKKIAEKQHKIGFHTRVLEVAPTVWTVYRRPRAPGNQINA